MEHIPIDIHVNKLQDWLLTRKVCKDNPDKLLNLKKSFKQLQTKFKSDVKLKDTSLYYDWKLFFNNQEPKETKNMFGKFNSDYMNEIKSLLDSYEKDNLYIYEIARIIAQNCIYEIPYLKKEINKAQELKQQYLNKEIEYGSKVTSYQTEFKEKCKDINIKGENINLELNQCLDKIPSTLNELYTKVLDIKNANNYYKEFSAALDSFSTIDKDSSIIKERLPIINSIIHGKPEMLIPTEKYNLLSNGHEKQQSSQNATLEDTKASEGGGDSNEVFTIEVIDEGIDISTPETNESDQNEYKLEKTRQFYETFPLGKKDFRNALIDELRELEAFLSLRLVLNSQESTSAKDNDDLALSLFVQSQNPVFSAFAHLLEKHEQMDKQQTISDYSQSVKGALNFALNDPKVSNLLLLLNDRDYVKKLCDILNRKLSLSKKMEEAKLEASYKRTEAEDTCKVLGKQLDLCFKTNKTLKLKLEKEISVRYQNRPVNIIGMVFS
ncbi:unnamed protein product [Gordionus sp. m RMFG-2023]|uniref:CDK5 regulatory subunit-associated protein 3-like n=1 Tax=Gordionus sp. m RMFG-2023 TaxID=3053472 RepID=UPI0030E4E5EA